MHADKIVGRVGTTILKNRVAEMGQGAQDTAARFRLDRLSSAQIASVVREVVSDPILTALVDVKIPDSLVVSETMPEGTVIHGNAGLGRNLDTDKDVLLTANGDEPGIADTVAYLTALGAREFKSHGDAWAEAAVRVIGTAPTQDDMRVFRAALNGLFAVPDLDLPLRQAGEFCAAVANAIHNDGLPIRMAIGNSLPSIGLPRDTAFFANERTFGTAITPWKKHFEKLAADRMPLLAKLRKNGQPIDAGELKERYESNEQEIADHARPVVLAFVNAVQGEQEPAKALAQLEWERDGVNLIFDRPKEKQLGLAAATLEFFEFDHPDALDARWRKHLEELKSREKRSDWQTPEDEEFFERHRHFIEESADLRKRWEKVVFGKPVECLDFLEGFVTVAHRLVLGAGETKGERFLRVRIRRGRKDWRTNFNHDVGAFFSLMYRGLAESLGERVEWKVDGQGTNPCDPLFDYPNFFEHEKNKDGRVKENTSGSRVATQLKFEVFLIEHVDGTEYVLRKTQLLWSARPQAIGLSLKEDVERLLEKGGVACTDVPRKLVSTKGAAQTVSLLDVGTLEAIFGRDSGSLVPPPGRLASMRKDIKDRIDEEAKNNRYSAEQRNEIRVAWDTFEADYILALNDFVNVGLHSETILNQAQSFGTLLRTLLEHARGDVCRSRLLARILAIGTARLSGEPPAVIIPPWHPERLKALSVKTRRSAGLVAHMLVGENVTFGDWKIFFRDFSEELEHPFYPEVALATQDNGLTLVSETATVNGYSLLEPPARGESGAMTDVLPGPAAKEIRELLERYVGLQPHEADNLSVLLYDADAAALPLAAIRELESMQTEGGLQCNVAVRHRESAKLRGIYSELVSNGDADPDVPIVSETSNNFISKLRVSVSPPGSNPPKTPDGFKPFDVAFLHDVVARTATVEWLPIGYTADYPDLEHAPSRWSYRAVSGEDELKAATYLTCPRQTRSGRAWVDAIHAAERQTDHVHGTTYIPARRISLQDDKLRSMLDEAHSLAEWVATYDELLDKRQLRANNVTVVRYRRQRTNGRNVIVSSTSELRLLAVLVKRRLVELGLALTDEQIEIVAKRLVDDALSVSGDIVLRAAKRGVSAGELIGLVLSRWLMEQEFNAICGGGTRPRLMVFFLLDDYAAWLAQQENRLADLLGVCVEEDGDSIKFHISVVESKYVSANSAADAKRSSVAQLGATLSTLDEALFGDPGRLDRDLWLSRLSDLLLDATVQPGLTGLLERARSAVRDGAVTISMRGYSQVFVHSPDANGGSPGSERLKVEVKGTSSAVQEVFDRPELRHLLEAYAVAGDSFAIRKVLGADEPWADVQTKPPARRTTWTEMVDRLIPAPKTPTDVVPHADEEASEGAQKTSTTVKTIDEVHFPAPVEGGSTQPASPVSGAVAVESVVLPIVAQRATAKAIPPSGIYGSRLTALVSSKAAGGSEVEEERTLWAEDVTRKLKSALNSYGLQAQVLGTRLTPNGCLVRLAGSDKLRVVDIEARQLQLLTTHGIRLVTVQPKPGEIVVTLAGDKRQAVSLWDVWAARKVNRNAAGINVSFILGLQELNGSVLYLNLGGDFGGLTQHEPHSLVAGATGSGKSVLIQALLLDIAATNPSSLAKIILIDPKMGVDYVALDTLPHLREPVVTEKEKATEVLAALVDEMESRYRTFAAARVRDLATFNAAAAPSDRLPMVFVVHDEFADWMLDDAYKSSVSAAVQRLGVKARAAGIHLFFAAQRPDKDVMPMQLRDNLGNRLILKVASEATSKIVLDRPGAEMLLGRGHLAARLSGEQGLVYAQAPFLSDPDMAEAVEAIKHDDMER
jgi:S-DNA-T family DNA segregation ATPase FtsK/SpoIIIE